MKTKNNLAIPTIIAVTVAVSILVALSATASAADINVPVDYTTIQAAVTGAGTGDTIHVAAGTYPEGIVTINKDLTIIGVTSSKPTINPTTGTGTANTIGSSGRGWFQIHNGATVTFKNLVFDGSGKNIYTAVHYHGDSAGGTVKNCDFVNIRHGIYQGRGINNYGQHVAVLDCTFTNIGRIGVFTFNPSASTLIKGCTYTGKGAGDWLDYAFEVGKGAAITVEGCTITECTASGSGWGSAGILVTSLHGPTPQATITGNDIHSNSEGVGIGYGDSDSSIATLTCNEIHNNDVGVYIRSDGTTVTGNQNDIYDNVNYGVEVNSVCSATYDFEKNWWGDVSGPTHASNLLGTGDTVSVNVDFDPWSFTPDPCEPTKTIGFWKNYPDSVEAVLALLLDETISLGLYPVSTPGDAQAVFNNAKNKNANTMLAAQLLAAELNVLHLEHLGIDYCGCIGLVITAADEFLTTHVYNGPDNPGTVPKEDKQEANGYKDDLDEYNQGECPCT